MYTENTEQGLGKFNWGSICRGLARLACAFIPGGAEIMAYVDREYPTFFEFKVSEYIPTPSETKILNDFSKSQLAPFITALDNQLNAALLLKTIGEQVAAINKIIAKCCYINAHYAEDQEALINMASTFEGLSYDAIGVKMGTVEMITSAFLARVNKVFVDNQLAVEYYQTQLNFPKSSTEFFPLLIRMWDNSSYYCNQVRLLNNSSTVVIAPNANATTTNGNTGVVSPVVTNPGSTSEKDNTGWILGGLAALGLGLALFTGKKKK